MFKNISWNTHKLLKQLNKNFSTSRKMKKSAVFDLTNGSRVQIEEFFNSFDTVLSDCDGVLWIDNNPIISSPETMNYFKKIGKKVFYVTNNSTKSRTEIAAKAEKLGFPASKDNVITTSYLAAQYLKGINFNKKVYIIGSIGIADELNAVGISSVGVGPDPVKPNFKEMDPSELDPAVGAVVVGFDAHISYPKLMKAASYLSNEKCLFIATNTDERFPKDGSIVLPGTGAIVSAVETCAERKPLVLGKPHAFMRKFVESAGLNPARTLMIGDRRNTDIEFGVRCGFVTLLVLSGVTSAKDVEKFRVDKTPPLPDFILPSLGDLLTLLKDK